MFKKNKIQKTSLKVNQSYTGETIEQKVERITTNKEPIRDGAPLVYTDRSEGVRADTNIRTDRWDIAIDAMDTVTKANQAKREERAKAKEDAKIVEMKKKEGGESGKNEAGG